MTDSYRVAVPYTWNYQAELNPLRTRLVLLRSGLRPTVIRTACELGYGQGQNLVLHAAASPVAWHGTDLNPVFAATARRLAAAAGAEVAIHDEAFASFCTRTDLPQFDFIGLHGVWSWVGEADRAVILHFVESRLRPGGVLYLGYNALPGWASFLPIRELLVEHAEAAGGPGAAIVDHIGGAMAFVADLLATGPTLARDTPQLAAMLDSLARLGRGAVAHELFTRDWQPMSFGTVARWLAPFGLVHAGAADLSDVVDRLDMTAAQRRLVDGLADPVLQQLVRDSIFNKRFRRDYWVKDPRPLSAAERDAAIRDELVVATGAVTALPLPLRMALTLQPEGPVADAVSAVLAGLSSRQPCRLGDLEDRLAGDRVPPGKLLDAVIFLAAHGLVETAQDLATAAAVRPRTDRLNRHLLEDEPIDGTGTVLASPVTGGGVALADGEHHILGAAAPVEAAAGNGPARAFLDERLPLLRALQVV